LIRGNSDGFTIVIAAGRWSAGSRVGSLRLWALRAAEISIRGRTAPHRCRLASVECTELADGLSIEERLATYRLRRVRPGTIEMILRGGMHDRAVPVATEYLLREIAQVGTLRFFVDTTGIASYTSEFRKLWTAWLSERRAQVPEVHVLVASRLVAMGVQLANIAMGGTINVYSDRRRYEAAIFGSSAQSTVSGS